MKHSARLSSSHVTQKIQLAGRIAIFEIGAAALVAVVALSWPRPRPVRGFEELASNPPQPREQHIRWADYRPLLLRSGAVILVTGALLVGLRTRRP